MKFAGPVMLLASFFTSYPEMCEGSENWRIVNGTDVPPGKYPSQVSIYLYGLHLCGGSILDQYHVLTAAHCAKGNLPSFLKVISGTVDLRSGGYTHQVTDLTYHEDFDKNDNYRNDIAVLKVDPPFVFDDITAPVTLPAPGHVTPPGETATVIGWRNSETGGDLMDILQEVDLVVVGDEDCSRIHEGKTHPTNICAGVPEGGKGQCNGDSGGPLFVNGYQAGIVSWSVKPCAIAPYPGVYTEVSQFIDWINSKLE